MKNNRLHMFSLLCEYYDPTFTADAAETLIPADLLEVRNKWDYTYEQTDAPPEPDAGPPAPYYVVLSEDQTPEQALDALVARAVGKLRRAPGKFVLTQVRASHAVTREPGTGSRVPSSHCHVSLACNHPMATWREPGNPEPVHRFRPTHGGVRTRVHSQAFLQTMRSLTDGVRWKGIGGPSDGESEKTFAQRVRETTDTNHPTTKWESVKGRAAAQRGTSAYHIYNYELQRRVEAPTDEDDNARNKRQRLPEAPPAGGPSGATP